LCLIFAVCYGDHNIYPTELAPAFGVLNFYSTQSPSVFPLKILVYPAFIHTYTVFFRYLCYSLQLLFAVFL
jgi:hypothetical protein